MKQLGNLALVCANRNDILLQIYNGVATVHAGEGPDRETLTADWTDDTTVSKIIHELNFGKFQKNTASNHITNSGPSPAFTDIQKFIHEQIVKNNEDIQYWLRCENYIAEKFADEIAERNEKLEKLMTSEAIDENMITRLIETETDAKLVMIYEDIHDELFAA